MSSAEPPGGESNISLNKPFTLLNVMKLCVSVHAGMHRYGNTNLGIEQTYREIYLRIY